MLWEILYSVVFFVLPLLGMSATVIARAFVEAQVDTNEEDAIVIYGENRKLVKEGVVHFNQYGVVIDLDMYRKVTSVRRVMKKNMHARDGPWESNSWDSS